MAITSREQDYSAWYNDIVQHAKLAENSAVRGCMVIKPYGFAIRENIKYVLDHMFKATGHQNAYFPLFIPKSFLSKEAAHVDGFAKECAVVTHHRLKASEDGKSVVVDPEAKLDEELIVRPTSETIIRNTYKDWIQSHRDLPLLINQWANVVRWEMRTRTFLRTTEFLWQEGHTAHATKEEAIQETMKMLDVYHDFVSHFLGIYSITGEKTEHERFAGADATYSFEPMMQDGKALQAGTSHFLGQNFARAFDVTFTNEDNQKELVRSTSRGVSTRLMGGLIMAHSDDKGLVLPPAVAPLHIVIIPLAKTDEDMQAVKAYIKPLIEVIKREKLTFYSKYFDQALPITYKIDDDDQHGLGRKCTQRELQGVPLRFVVGKKEMEQGKIEVYRRDTGEKELREMEKLLVYIDKLLYKIQNDIFRKHTEMSKQQTFIVDSYEDFKDKVQQGFVLAHRDGTTETEQKIQEETGATIRCIPFSLEEYGDEALGTGSCVLTGKVSDHRVVFARAY